jgi:hypothetical protein
VVDEVRVLRLLRSISDDLAVLRAETSADPGRNVLVRDYVEVDDGIVLERLVNLWDLDAFVSVVAAWVVPAGC